MDNFESVLNDYRELEWSVGIKLTVICVELDYMIQQNLYDQVNYFICDLTAA